MAIRNKKRVVRSKKKITREIKKKAKVRLRSKKDSLSKLSILEESGLIGSLTGTGITSTNYKDFLRKK